MYTFNSAQILLSKRNRRNLFSKATDFLNFDWKSWSLVVKNSLKCENNKRCSDNLSSSRTIRAEETRAETTLSGVSRIEANRAGATLLGVSRWETTWAGATLLGVSRWETTWAGATLLGVSRWETTWVGATLSGVSRWETTRAGVVQAGQPEQDQLEQEQFEQGLSCTPYCFMLGRPCLFFLYFVDSWLFRASYVPSLYFYFKIKKWQYFTNLSKPNLLA